MEDVSGYGNYLEVLLLNFSDRDGWSALTCSEIIVIQRRQEPRPHGEEKKDRCRAYWVDRFIDDHSLGIRWSGRSKRVC